jgi:hypothetical protein
VMTPEPVFARVSVTGGLDDLKTSSIVCLVSLILFISAFVLSHLQRQSFQKKNVPLFLDLISRAGK